MPSVTYYDVRPMSLIYHTNEFHVMDIKVQKVNFGKHFSYIFQTFKCSCNDISFRSVNDLMTVSSNQEISQSGDEESTCSTKACYKSMEYSEDIRCVSKGTESDEKKHISREKIKVINFLFLSEMFMIKLISIYCMFLH